MATKIKQLTIIKQTGSQICFCVGATYNGLLLYGIEDKSIEFPDSVTIIHRGYTSDARLVFEVINAPVVVEYEPA